MENPLHPQNEIESDAYSMRSKQPDANIDCVSPSGSQPRVESELRAWLMESKGLTFGTDKEKADLWQKAASRMEKLARTLEDELAENGEGENKEERRSFSS